MVQRTRWHSVERQRCAESVRTKSPSSARISSGTTRSPARRAGRRHAASPAHSMPYGAADVLYSRTCWRVERSAGIMGAVAAVAIASVILSGLHRLHVLHQDRLGVTQLFGGAEHHDLGAWVIAHRDVAGRRVEGVAGFEDLLAIGVAKRHLAVD